MSVPATMGKILWVDLASGQTRIERPSDEIYLNYLGGYGLGAYYLYKTQRAGIDPLGPENTLGLLTGLLTGTGGITSNRYVVVAKSPKTDGWGDANSGGTFGPAMKGAGLDGIFFTGRSERPVYLLVRKSAAGSEGRCCAELLPAEDWWGLDTAETDDRARELHGPQLGIPTCFGVTVLGGPLQYTAPAAAPSGHFPV